MQFKALCKPSGHPRSHRLPRPDGMLTKTWKVMKLTAFLLLAAFCQVSARTTAQTVTYTGRSAPLVEVLTAIEKQTGYTFFYRKEDLAGVKPVTVELRDVPLADALKAVLSDQPIEWGIEGNTVVLSRKAGGVVAAPPARADSVPRARIYGRVTDSTGAPLVGASVRIKGTKVGTSTDSKGDFVLPAQGEQAVIIVSYTSYETQEIKVNGLDNIAVRLKYSTSPLDEVHVIAYGTATERYSVGSISKVGEDVIALQPVSNPLAALEGQVPGLVITQSSGVPGSSFSAQIRGQNSLGASPESLGKVPLDNPLYIIDGVPFAPQNNNVNQLNSLAAPGTQSIFNNYNGGMSPFNSINPADIESIEVLRDADATAIYGSRGANGVIIITTKRGKAGKTRFDANVYDGEDRITRTVPMMNITQYLKMRNEAFINDGATPQSYDVDVNGTFDTTRNANWRKEFLGGTARSTDANVSLSGGSGNTQFLVGAGYRIESYVTPGDFSDKRGSVNVSFKHTSLDRRLFLEFLSNYSYDVNNSSGQPNTLLAFTLPPDYPALLDQNNNLVWEYNGADLGNSSGNPLAYLKQKYTVQTYNLVSHLQIGYKLLPGLTVQSSFGYNLFNNQEMSLVPFLSQDPSMNPVSSSQFASGGFGRWIIEPQASYNKAVFGGRFSLLIGGTFEKNYVNQTSINGTNYSNDALLGSISSAGSTTAYGTSSLYKYDAAFGRLNYIWKESYLLDITGRRDGSSRFGPGRQFGDFGSIGGGWIFSQNRYIKNAFPFLSFGKVRATYGTSGNDNIGNYQYLSAWSPINQVSYQGQVGYRPLNLFNPNFSWDLNKKLEGGLELGFLKDRIFLSSTWYRNRCGNQLVSYLLPEQTGFQSVTQNAPYSVQNAGWEFQIKSTNIKSKLFSWSTSVNLTIPQNKLLSFPGLSSSPYRDVYIVGKSLATIQGFRLLGVNDTTGIYQFASAQGPSYTPNYPTTTTKGDYHVFGNLNPKFYGGLNNQISYKGFQINIMIQFTKQLGASYLAQVYDNLPPGEPTNQPVSVLSRWQKPGDKSNIEKFTQEYGGTAFNAVYYYLGSNAAYSDASFIRVKTVGISYSIPSVILKRLKAEGCRIFVNAQNLFTITGYKGPDPESQSLYGIPPLKTIVAGLNFTL